MRKMKIFLFIKFKICAYLFNLNIKYLNNKDLQVLHIYY